jgi:oxygen-independent coproporphyrinogen-3 oxidase
LRQVAAEFGEDVLAGFSETIADLVRTGLLERQGDVIRLTPQGRLLSNEVFERFIALETSQVRHSAKAAPTTG